MTDAKLLRTDYDRSTCEVGIVHIGFGAFTVRINLSTDDYMQQTGDCRWGIAAVNLRASESADFAQAAQMEDGYVLKSIAPSGETSYRLVRSHLGCGCCCRFGRCSSAVHSAKR